jgi:NAD(P)-dependent dehydrogenase (short-subunit alcohol dehydrogenase family)
MSHPSQEIVVITGASAGVGRAVALEFASRGARIGLLARNKERLEETRREVHEMGGEALAIPTDVSDPKQVEAAAELVEQTYGPIDIWINNAMVSVFSPVRKMEPEDYRRVTEVTYLGTVYGTLAALRRMGPRNQGRIVQVGSALAYRGIPLQSAYCAAKHAIEGFMESLRCELIHDGSRIKVSMVQMPALNTPQFDWVKSRLAHRAQPVPPIFQPEVAARAVYWAAHHDQTELEVGFPTLIAILANKIVPRWVDRYLARTGYDSQQTKEMEDPKRPNNLWESVPGHYGAHGRFDARAHSRSAQLWARMHTGWLALAGLCLTAAGFAAKRPKKYAATPT